MSLLEHVRIMNISIVEKVRQGNQGGGNKPLYAAIDVGSNNLRLLIAGVDEHGEPHVVDAFSRAVRLGAHLCSAGKLDDEALTKAVDALRICASKVRRARVAGVRAVATEVCRRAGNQQRLVDTVKRQTGLDLEIITCAEEARLAMLGVSPLMDPAATDFLVFDIGGGSSEVVWGQRQPDGTLGITDHISLPFGVVSLMGKIEETAEGRRLSYDRLRTELQVALFEAEQRWQLRERVEAGKVQVMGASGTVTTLAGLLLGLTKYDRTKVDGTDLDTQRALGVINKLLGEDPQDRARHGCIGKNRCELVLPGCAIFEAIVNIWPVASVRVADRGVREGILIDLARQSQ
jgi:exopolyphosphatase / guanosine-5'-triphosphate,3'-diphosphate pyrophosphatase